MVEIEGTPLDSSPPQELFPRVGVTDAVMRWVVKRPPTPVRRFHARSLPVLRDPDPLGCSRLPDVRYARAHRRSFGGPG